MSASSESKWKSSAAYAELRDALTAHGYAPDLADVDAESEWPMAIRRSTSPVMLAWSAAMRKRVGLPEEQPAFQRAEVERKPVERVPRYERREEVMAVLPTDPEFAIGIKTLTRRLGHGDAMQPTIRSTVKKLVERGLVARAHDSAIGVRRGAVRNADRQAFYRVA